MLLLCSARLTCVSVVVLFSSFDVCLCFYFCSAHLTCVDVVVFVQLVLTSREDGLTHRLSPMSTVALLSTPPSWSRAR